MFSGCTVLHDSKETRFGSSNQEASLLAGKNTRVVLVPFCIWKCVPTAISGGVDISKVPGCHFCDWMMVTKITSIIDVSNSQPPFISNSMN